jgi:hypothetical protein
MVDGPVKFNQTTGMGMTIENKSQFGRTFSIVRIPYALKVLMQELQVMNVQMRIITEDNVDQLLSMAFSENIRDLLGYDEISSLADTITTYRGKMTGKVSESKQEDVFRRVKLDLPVKPDSPEFTLGEPIVFGKKEEEYNPRTPEGYVALPREEEDSIPYAPDSIPYAPDSEIESFNNERSFFNNEGLEPIIFDPVTQTLQPQPQPQPFAGLSTSVSGQPIIITGQPIFMTPPSFTQPSIENDIQTKYDSLSEEDKVSLQKMIQEKREPLLRENVIKLKEKDKSILDIQEEKEKEKDQETEGENTKEGKTKTITL